MFGCCSRAASLHLAREPLGRQSFGQLRRDDLDDDLAAERGLGRDEDARHAAAAELALDGVRVAERLLERLAQVRHLTLILV